MAKQEAYFAFTQDMLDQVTDDGAAINKMIASISRTNKTLQGKVAVCAASIVCRAIVHGDVSQATSLVDSLDGWRKNDLRQWFLDFGPFEWVTEEVDGKSESKFKLDQKRKHHYKNLYAKDQADMVQKLLEKPFWIYKKDPEFKPFDLLAQIAALIAKADGIRNNKDEAKAKHPKNNFSGMRELKTLYQVLKTQAQPENGNGTGERKPDGRETVTDVDFEEVDQAA